MRKLKLVGAIIGATLMGVAAAQAAPGYSTTGVNMRSGPDTEYPSVEIIPEGTALEIAGCLPDESWCDVIARAGWSAPPKGARVAGWWRKDYAAPIGMRPPPEHGWMRPHEPRDHERH